MSELFDVLQGRFASDEQLDFRVVAVSGQEAINRLFEYQLVVTSPQPALRRALGAASLQVADVERELLGRQVRFRVSDALDGSDRFAMIAAVREQGSHRQDGVLWLQLALTLVPAVWRLGQRRDSRIFQHLFTHEIVSQVLAQHGIRHRWSLNKSYGRRIYCTQYEETDLEFVMRLLAEEGILFYFEHRFGFEGGAAPGERTLREQGDTLVQGFRDAGDALKPLAGDLLGGVTGAVGDVVSTAKRFIAKDGEEPADDPDAEVRTQGGEGRAGPASDGEVWVMIDQGHGAYGHTPEVDDPRQLLRLEHRHDAGMEADPRQVLDLRRQRRLRPEAIERRDYDFRRPLFELKQRAESDAADTVFGDGKQEVYEHHGEYSLPDVHNDKVAVELEQHRADVLSSSGRSVNARLMAGHRVSVRDEIRGTDESLVLVRVEHHFVAADMFSGNLEGPLLATNTLAAGLRQQLLPSGASSSAAVEQLLDPEWRPQLRGAGGSGEVVSGASERDTSYEGRFDAVGSAVVYRPPRPARRMRNVVETATVVGPVKEDDKSIIYTDKYGRVKVQFHWDRKGQYNQYSSCFLRVSQPWAGAGFGFQFIPRVGMEVLVSFIGGDPDRPVVTGTLYNQTHPLPEPLPERATRSVIRTQTVPEGDGFNEIAFEDARGSERIVMHAQRDLDQHANNNHLLSVGGNDITVVKQTSKLNASERVVAIERDDLSLVGRHCSSNVGGNRTTRVAQNDSAQINGHQLSRVEGVSVRQHRVDALDSTHGHSVTHVGGSDMRHVGGSEGESYSISYVEGHTVITASGNITVRSDPSLGEGGGVVRLECGNHSAITISEDAITLSAKHIFIDGQQDTLIVGERGRLLIDNSGALIEHQNITAASTLGGRLHLNADAKLHGGKVSLLSPSAAASSSDSDEEEQQEPNFELLITHDSLDGVQRIASSAFRLVADDKVLEGTTTAEGLLRATVPDDVKVVEVSVWPDPKNKLYQALFPPESGPLRWLVQLLEEAPQAAADKSRMQLQNLGYRPKATLGEEDDKKPAADKSSSTPLDALTREALRAFQLDVLAEDGYCRAEKLRGESTAHKKKLEAGGAAAKKLLAPRIAKPSHPQLRPAGKLDENTAKLLADTYAMKGKS